MIKEILKLMGAVILFVITVFLLGAIYNSWLIAMDPASTEISRISRCKEVSFILNKGANPTRVEAICKDYISNSTVGKNNDFDKH